MFGHGELTVLNSTHAIWNWKKNINDESDKPNDTVTFVKMNGVSGGITTASSLV